MYPPNIAEKTPHAVAYVMATSGEELTFRELDQFSNALAHLLRGAGVQAGDSLVLLLPNCLAWPVAVAAGMRTGLEVTPINWHVGRTELLPMLTDARPGAVITSADLAPMLAEALQQGGIRPKLLLSVDGATEFTEDFWSSLRSQPISPVEGELLGARVLFSGGTTGRPKAYRQPLLGVHPLDAPARHPHLARVLGIEAGIRLLSPAPSYHAAPFTFQLMTLAAGGTVVCLERFDPTMALQALDTYQVTHSQWVPTMLSRLLAAPGRSSVNPARHAVAITSGAPCPPDLKDSINDWWGDILHEYYGASEGYGHTYISPRESRERRGSVGRPLGDGHVRIVDDLGSDVPPGTIGKVCFEATQPDGSTTLKGMGDMGRLDEDGFLYLTGRQSFMIISGGVNIYPEEIENVLVQHPEVQDVAVFGLPHDDLGEQVVAVVEPLVATATTGLEERLAEHCRASLARFKTPRRFVFVEELPRLPTGKLNKRALREVYASDEA